MQTQESRYKEKDSGDVCEYCVYIKYGVVAKCINMDI